MSESVLPSRGLGREKVFEEMKSIRSGDANWRAGRTFSLVYWASDELYAVARDALTMFMSENGLNPSAFPSLRQFEADVLAMTAELLGGGPTTVGAMTSGGSESLLLAVKTARDKMRAERPNITKPNMVVPLSIHPAVEKAAHYFGVAARHIPLDASLRADVGAAKDLIDDDTILVMGSAPAYPSGVIDPIPELAALASARGIPCHVDACLGGFLLPWLPKIGRPVAPFDLRVPGVTSISADLHKYGFTAKGASTLLYRDDSFRRYQYFAYTDWPGGLYGSPSIMGTRPGGSIAAAWAVMKYLGHDGYTQIARTIMDTSDKLIAGIRAIDGLEVLGEPAMGVFGFRSTQVDSYALGQEMNKKGWLLDMLQLPPGLHMMITPAHATIVDEFLTDLRATVRTLSGSDAPQAEGTAAFYGLAGTMSDRAPVKELIVEFLGQILPPRG